jgi:hypothetical protein
MLANHAVGSAGAAFLADAISMTQSSRFSKGSGC